MAGGKRRAVNADPHRVLEDLPSETGRPRSSCVDTTDTRTFAEYKSANFGKLGITFAYRIGDNTEQKRAAGFLLVPFAPPAEHQQYPRWRRRRDGVGCG